MRHTFYGDVQGSFVGSGWALFWRGFIPWLILLGPVVVMFFKLGAAAEGATQAQAQELAGDFVNRSGIWLLAAGAVIYPIFHAMVLRWRLAGMRFGTLEFSSTFSTWRFSLAYYKFFALLALIAIVATIVAVVVQSKIVPAWPLGTSVVVEFIGVVCLVIFYFVVATMGTFAYQGTVGFDTWRLIVDSLVLRGPDQLDRAKVHAGHAARHAGRIGAALNLGGF
jgi:hypothetical protein